MKEILELAEYLNFGSIYQRDDLIKLLDALEVIHNRLHENMKEQESDFEPGT